MRRHRGSAARLKCFRCRCAARKRCARRAAAHAGARQGRRGEDFGKPPPPPRITKITANVIELARSARGDPSSFSTTARSGRQLDGDDANVQDPQPGKR